MDKEDHCMALLYSFPNSCDNLVMAIGSTVKKLAIDEVVASLLSKEVRKKAFESSNEALVVIGRSNEKNKKKEKGRYRFHGVGIQVLEEGCSLQCT